MSITTRRRKRSNATTDRYEVDKANSNLRILRPAAAAAKLGLSKMTLYRLEAAGAIPSRTRISVHAVGWFERDLDAYLSSRQSVRETGPCRAPGHQPGDDTA
jgi:predicted DNA-binding transcriptional regulator AlpA